MKRHLLAAAAALAISAGPASATGLPVHDAGSNAARIIEAGRQLQQAIRQYQMLQNTYNALSHSTDVSGTLHTLGGASRTYMPEQRELADLLSGAGSMYGSAGRMLSSGRYVDVGAASAFAREMQRRELVTANIKALAYSGVEQAQASLANLGTLLNRVTASKDVTENTAVAGAIAVEEQNAARHQEQVQQMQLALAAEERTDRQRAEQMQHESAQELRDSTRPFGGGAQ